MLQLLSKSHLYSYIYNTYAFAEREALPIKKHSHVYELSLLYIHADWLRWIFLEEDIYNLLKRGFKLTYF